MLKYKKTVGIVDLYTSYLFSDNEYLPGDGLRYKHKGGGSLGVNYRIMDDLRWDTSWNFTRADMLNPDNNDSKSYDQNILGTALRYTPDNWTSAFGGGWYQNFLTTKKVSVNDYFAGDAWGIEYFAGYIFPVDLYADKFIQPYFMGNRQQYINGHDYQRIDNSAGISFQLDYGFHVDYEHVFTSSTDDLGDMNLVRLRYDF